LTDNHLQRLDSSGEIKGEEIDKKKRTLVTNLEDGWSKSVIAGSTGSGKSWSAMKNST
jgi:hypothetical protein